MGVSKEELARMVMRQALKDPRLFKELSKRGFELEKVPRHTWPTSFSAATR
jgi:hypothetical protein